MGAASRGQNIKSIVEKLSIFSPLLRLEELHRANLYSNFRQRSGEPARYPLEFEKDGENNNV